MLSPKKIPVFPLTDRPCLLCQPCNFYGLPEKNKNIFIPNDTSIFRKFGNQLKDVRIAKILLTFISLNFLDVINFIICIFFSGTVDEI